MSDFSRKHVRDVLEGAKAPFKRQGDFIYDGENIGVKLADDKIHVLAKKAPVDESINDVNNKINEVESRIPDVTQFVTTDTEQYITAMKSFGSVGEEVQINPDGTLVVTQPYTYNTKISSDGIITTNVEDGYTTIDISKGIIKVSSHSQDSKVKHYTKYTATGLERDIDRGNTALDIDDGWNVPESYCYIKNSILVVTIPDTNPTVDVSGKQDPITVAVIPNYITKLLLHDVVIVFNNNNKGVCYPGCLESNTGKLQLYTSNITKDDHLSLSVVIPLYV